MKNVFYVFRWMLQQIRGFWFNLIIMISFTIISSVTGVYRALLSKQFIDYASSGNMKMALRPLYIIGFFIIFDLSSGVLLNILNTFTYNKIANHIQEKIYRHLSYVEWRAHSQQHSGKLLTKLTNDVAVIASLITSTIPNLFYFSTMLVSSTITLFVLEPRIALIALIVAPIAIAASRLYGRKVKEIYNLQQDQDGKFRAFMQDTIQNILIVKTYCLEQQNIEKLKEIQKVNLSYQMKKAWISSFSSLVLQLGAWSSYILVFVWGIFNLNSAEGSFGTMTALLQLVGGIQGAISMLATTFPQVVSSFAAAERLMSLLELPLEKNGRSFERRIESFEIPKITFREIDFQYEENYKVLNNLSLEIYPGETIALVGPFGQGKTTLLRLLLSLLTPAKGEIKISTNNIQSEIDRSLREWIAYVPQGNTLFTGSIEENLRYGNPHATLTQVEEALRLACAHDFIMQLPKGLSTMINEKGGGLSEGQAQRICIARALLGNKPILVLDEATSALDHRTELKVLKAIQTLENHPTTIIITHRPSALEICDRVLYLENGNIKEVGA